MTPLRESVALKPVFFVKNNLPTLQALIEKFGGGLREPKDWTLNGYVVCDGWDSDGNIFQLRIPTAPNWEDMHHATTNQYDYPGGFQSGSIDPLLSWRFRITENGIRARGGFFTLNGTWLGLYPYQALAEDAQVTADDQNAQRFNGFTLAYNVASEQEVHQIIDEAVAAGAIITKPAQKVFWGGYSSYFKEKLNN